MRFQLAAIYHQQLLLLESPNIMATEWCLGFMKKEEHYTDWNTDRLYSHTVETHAHFPSTYFNLSAL